MNKPITHGAETIAPMMTSLGDVPRIHARLRPNAVAISFDDRKTTYGELDKASNQVANGLANLGLKAGDRVAFLDKNTDRFFEIWLGVAKLNGVIVPINARLAPPEIEYVINDAEAKVLFIGEPFLKALAGIQGRLRGVEKIVVVGPDFDAWRNEQNVGDISRSSSPDDVCMQLYTSGTTGHPKGVQLTNKNLLTGAPHTLAAWGNWSAYDAALVAMPLFHIAGCGSGMLGLIAGLRVVMVRDFVPDQVIQVIQKERITVAFLVPAMIKFLLDEKSIVNADLSSVRRIVYGASPIPLKLLQGALDRFSAAGFVQIYGLTETTGGITVLSPEDHADPRNPRLQSCGRAIPGVELRIEDLDGNPVKAGEVGEIVCRTVKNMKAYWKKPDETVRVLRDGWLRTGDAGYVDAEGYLYIQDRVKDMIVSGGENIYPAEVESAMFGHPAIADIAVIGVPDEQWGEAVKAIIVAKQGVSPNPGELVAYARERLAGYKVPKSIDFVESLPRNPTGKVLKRELREQYWKGFNRKVN
jgi:acyl-CoA synthetase (AMP-forming)/AMP-acid ligase II